MKFLKNRRCGFSLTELLLAIGILAILIVAMSAGISSMSEKARGLECVAKLKALGTGILRYTMDHQGMLPARSKPVNSAAALQWHREVWPSLREDGDQRDWATARNEAEGNGDKRWPFRCPGDQNPLSATPGLSYAINENLLDSRIGQLGAKQVLLLEFKDRYTATGTAAQLDLRLPNRHGGKNYLLFADYHIEAMTASEVPNLANAPEAWRVLK